MTLNKKKYLKNIFKKIYLKKIKNLIILITYLISHIILFYPDYSK